jgi:diguanylate cyclase (GGDEF)-like protein
MNPTNSHRILLIDDQQSIHDDYRKVLGVQQPASVALDKATADLFNEDQSGVVTWEGFELDSALQGEEGFELVKRSLEQGRPYAMAFVDIRMPPGWDGVQTVCRIWEVDPEILVVICSAYSDYSWEDMVSRLGRNDRFLILKKPFDNTEVRQCAMVLAERWSVSRTDVLTGLLNRRTFQGHMKLEWSRSARHGLPMACALVDLDFFKRVNDDFGHTAGDVVLKIVAQRLQTLCRASDSVCRYGGEEFCILLPHTDESGAAAWAENVRQAIAAMPAMIGEKYLQVTASFGVAQRHADDDRIELLIDRADQALLAAKRAGRNRVMRFTAIAQNASQGRLQAEPIACTAHSQMVQAAQAIVETATDLAELIDRQTDDRRDAIARADKLKKQVANLLTCLGGNVPAIVQGDGATQIFLPSGPSAVTSGH